MKKKWLKDNRGAALISIMIAVAFISILASTLLYMAYSNYKMKVLNYESKVNFYGTEHDMTVLSTGIRNEVAMASNPEDELEKIVGFTANAGGVNGRYNPSKLAAVVYPDYAFTATESKGEVEIDANRDYNSGLAKAYDVEFSTDISSPADNYIVDTTSESGITKITLKGVVIKQTAVDGSYENKIVTDMVFRVKQTIPTGDAGGIGKFSVLSDSGVTSPSGSDGTRIEMYGNVFIGPKGGEYKYLDDNKTVNPGGTDALVLDGDTSFVAYGDYMVVFGNVVLKDEAVLQVVGGNLTVYGDIILEGAGSGLICTGKLYMLDGLKPGSTTESYGIKTTGSSNVIPKTLISDGPEKVEADKYKDLITTLDLEDATHTDDGILPQVLSADGAKKLKAFTTGYESRTASSIDMFGIEYKISVWSKSSTPINNGNLANTLCFMVGSNNYFGDATISSPQNLNTTFICLEDIELQNTKTLRFSQVGSEVFNFMLLKKDEKGQINNDKSQSYMEYSDATHKIIDGQYGATSAANTNVASIFKEGNAANEVVNKVLGLATNGGGEDPIVQTAIGYENWHKE